MTYVSRLLAVVLLAFFALDAQSANAAKRVALVIGNGHYAHIGSLKNSLNDAGDMAAKLRGLGFEVVAGDDLTAAGFKSIIKEFLQKLQGSELALFYYAGHGMQADNVNYVLPVDVELKSAADVLFDAVSVQDIVRFMENEAATTVVLLDSCRDNPFLNAGMSTGTRGVYLYSSFVPQSGTSGTYIAFAAQPGQVSYDGDGRNSPFTQALLNHIADKDADIRIMMSDVRREVIAATNNRQVPWENSALIGRLSLNPSPDGDNAGDRATRRERFKAERAAWDKIVASSNAGDFIDFLAKYPDGVFASTAREQLRRLVQQPPPKIVPKIAIVSADKQPSAASPSQAAIPMEAASAGSVAKAPVANTTVNAAPSGAPATATALPAEKATAVQVPEQTIRPADQASASASSGETAVVVRGAEIVEPRPEASSPAQPGAVELAAIDPLSAFDPAKRQALRVPPPEPAPSTAGQPPAPADQTAMVRDVQQELIRLGCLEAQADGVWGPQSMSALDRYLAQRPTVTALLDPDAQMLDLLSKEQKRVCPPTCSAREVLKGDQCVAKTCKRGQELTAAGACRAVARVVTKRQRQKAEPRYQPEPEQQEPYGGEHRRHGGFGCFSFNGLRLCE